MQNIHESIKAIRLGVGMTQSDLAKRAGVSIGYISKLEAGVYNTLSVDKSQQLAKGFGLTFKDFLERLGLLEGNPATPHTNSALSLALRQRDFSDAQIQKVISYVDFLDSESK